MLKVENASKRFRAGNFGVRDLSLEVNSGVIGLLGPNGAGIYKTQGEAIEAARQTLHRQGGGELIVKGRDGRIRSKDTIAPGHDPNPPRDREH